MLPFTEDYIFQIAAGTQQMYLLRSTCVYIPYQIPTLLQLILGLNCMPILRSRYDLVIDLERAGVRPPASSHAMTPKQVAAAPLLALPETAAVPGRPIMQFVMVHDPGNTVNSHRRRFYSGL